MQQCIVNVGSPIILNYISSDYFGKNLNDEITSCHG